MSKLRAALLYTGKSTNSNNNNNHNNYQRFGTFSINLINVNWCNIADVVSLHGNVIQIAATPIIDTDLKSCMVYANICTSQKLIFSVKISRPFRHSIGILENRRFQYVVENLEISIRTIIEMEPAFVLVCRSTPSESVYDENNGAIRLTHWECEVEKALCLQV